MMAMHHVPSADPVSILKYFNWLFRDIHGEIVGDPLHLLMTKRAWFYHSGYLIRTIGPTFLHDTVISEGHVNGILGLIFQELTVKETNMRIFKQDNALTHTAESSVWSAWVSRRTNNE
jgi:hypothetical protein